MQYVSKKNRQSGFTMLELLIYIGILSVLVVVSTNIFISLSKGRGQSQARSEVHDAIRFATERIKQDIKNASVLTTPTVLSPTGSTLVLTVSGVTTTYDVSGGVLRQTQGVGSPVAITGPNIVVDTLTFVRITNTNATLGVSTTSLQVTMTMHYASTSNDWMYTDSLQTTVTLP